MWTPALIDDIKSNIEQSQSHACSLVDAIHALDGSPLWLSSNGYQARKNIRTLPVSPCRRVVGAIRYIYHRWQLMRGESMKSLVKALQHHSSTNDPIPETVSGILHHETHTQSTGYSYRFSQLERHSNEYLQAITGMLEHFTTAVKQSQTHPSQLRNLPLANWTHDLQWFEEQLSSSSKTLWPAGWTSLSRGG